MMEAKEQLLHPREAAELLAVHPQTLRFWDRTGKLKPIRLPSGQRRYRVSDLEAILGRKHEGPENVAGIYARVGTRKQADAGNLDRQVGRLREYAENGGFQIALEATDISSGLNPNRRGLRKAIAAARRGEIRFLLIEYPDRLARFGYEYLLELFEVLGAQVITVSGTPPEDAHSELVKDLLAIVTSFSARIYGARGGKKARKALQQALAEVKPNEPER